MSSTILEISTGFFAEALKNLRRRMRGVDHKGRALMSQKELAKMAGCELDSYRQWEQGRVSPSAEGLIKVMRLCPDMESLALFGIVPKPCVREKLHVDIHKAVNDNPL